MKLVRFALVALLFTKVQGQGNGAVRLFNNGVASVRESGIVEVYYNSKWNTVCTNKTDLSVQVANTICRQLGYFDGVTTTNSGFGVDSTSPGFSSVSCENTDITILSCDYDTTSAKCSSDDYLAVECSTLLFGYIGRVQLTGFTEYSGKGRIEAYCSDWGLVCNDGFTKNDADTVCRQLGYTEAINYGSNYGPGDSSQSVLVDKPGCGSKAKCLLNCKGCPSSSSHCSVNNVAGVMCSYNTTSSRDAGRYCACKDAGSRSEIKGLVGIIIGLILAFIVCVLVIVLIPIICCCCLGVGIGAVARRPRYSNI